MLKRLEELGVVREVTGQERSRIYLYAAYMDILNQGAEPFPVCIEGAIWSTKQAGWHGTRFKGEGGTEPGSPWPTRTGRIKSA